MSREVGRAADVVGGRRATRYCALSTFVLCGLAVAISVHGETPVATTLLTEGQQLEQHGEVTAAHRRFASAVDAARALGREDLLAKALFEQADALTALGQPTAGLAAARESLAIARRRGDDAQSAWSLDAVGNALFFLGDNAGAESSFLEAAALMKAVGDEIGEATAWKDAGIAAKLLGRFDEAFTRLQAAEQIFRRLGLVNELVSTLHNRAAGLDTIGLPEQALELYQEAIDLAERGGNWEVAEGNATRLGYLLVDAGDPERGAEQFRHALELCRRRGAPDLPWIVMGLSWAYEQLGDLDQALRWRREALRLDEARDANPVDLAAHHSALSSLLEARDPSESRRQLDRAIALYLAHPEKLGWNGAVAVAAALERGGQLDLAMTWFERAMTELEQARSRLGTDEWRSRFLDHHQAVYQRAFEAERERLPATPTSSDSDRLLTIFERSRNVALDRALDSAAPGPRPLEHLAPLPPDEIRAALSPTTALIGYFVGRRHAYALVVTSNGTEVVDLDVVAEHLGVRVASFRELFGGHHPLDAEALSRRLYQDLVEPVRSRLPSAIHDLVLLPDGALSELPFEALAPGSGRPALLAEFAISYGTSASEWIRCSRSPSGRASAERVALVGFVSPTPHSLALAEAPGESALYREEGFRMPRLPGAEEEMAMARRLIGGTVRIHSGAAASEEIVRQETSGQHIDVLHFATHGLLSERSPGHSALVLSRSERSDGLLQAREIYRLRLDADLVILSACQSARGPLLRGQGAHGLARAFLHAGARSVLATLWPIDDAESADFIAAFYRHLARGLSKAEALRRAKLERRQASARTDWAAFVLIGDGGSPVRIERRPWWRQVPTPMTATLLVLLATLVGVLAGRRVVAGREFSVGAKTS